jgi:hypothetical protein
MAKRKSKEIPISFEKTVQELADVLYRMAEAFQQAVPTPEAVADVAHEALSKDLKAIEERIARLEAAAGEKKPAPSPAGADADDVLKQVRVRLAILEKKFSKPLPPPEEKRATSWAQELTGAAPPVPDVHALRSFLQSNEVKEFLDERFKAFRTWMKTDEIPKIVREVLASKSSFQ